jgi:hypothetical protein
MIFTSLTRRSSSWKHKLEELVLLRRYHIRERGAHSEGSLRSVILYFLLTTNKKMISKMNKILKENCLIPSMATKRIHLG